MQKLLEQLKSDLKKAINLNKYVPKLSVQAPKPSSELLFNPSFQGVNRLFCFIV